MVTINFGKNKIQTKTSFFFFCNDARLTNLTVGSRESGVTMAQVFGDQILTVSVDARIVGAIVDVGLTMLSYFFKNNITNSTY